VSDARSITVTGLYPSWPTDRSCLVGPQLRDLSINSQDSGRRALRSNHSGERNLSNRGKCPFGLGTLAACRPPHMQTSSPSATYRSRDSGLPTKGNPQFGVLPSVDHASVKPWALIQGSVPASQACGCEPTINSRHLAGCERAPAAFATGALISSANPRVRTFSSGSPNVTQF